MVAWLVHFLHDLHQHLGPPVCRRTAEARLFQCS